MFLKLTSHADMPVVGIDVLVDFFILTEVQRLYLTEFLGATFLLPGKSGVNQGARNGLPKSAGLTLSFFSFAFCTTQHCNSWFPHIVMKLHRFIIPAPPCNKNCSTSNTALLPYFVIPLAQLCKTKLLPHFLLSLSLLCDKIYMKLIPSKFAS